VAYISAGRPQTAEQTIRKLIDAQPGNIEALHTLAASLEQQSRVAEAGEAFRRVLELSPTNPRALAGHARVLQTEGRSDEARALLASALGAPRVQPVVLSTYAGLCVTPEQRRACISAARAVIEDLTVSAQDRAGLCFAIARLLDAEGDADAAFEMYTRANDLYPKLYNPHDRRAYTDDIIRTFSAQTSSSLPRARSGSHRPVFILGMPRSGTTLVEQILAAHPQVHAGGELQEMRRIWRDLVTRLGGGMAAGLARLTQRDVDDAAGRYLSHLSTLHPDAPRVTDKMPHNFEQLGLINLLLPEARVIHCIRDPRDTCVSCYTTQFSTTHAYSNDLAHLGHAYGEYHRLMAHWRTVLDIPVLDVVYEDVVGDIDAAARRIVEFVGLPWDDACTRFYEAKRAVTTASVEQVRKPVYSSSVARWRRYERRLGPLIDSLRAAGVPLHDAPARGR
jgi:tetratricopeptide (TPR) repeat protein